MFIRLRHLECLYRFLFCSTESQAESESESLNLRDISENIELLRFVLFGCL